MSTPVPEKRVAEFEKFGFGMFIHWGLYSQLGRGEWVQHHEKIPSGEYEKLASTFTASEFDAHKIAETAKKAGAKYITLTTRHHEGFSLYDTRGLCSFDSPHTPAGRDLIREFVDACNDTGIAPFFYHTTLDWHHPDFNADFKSYLKYLRASVEILCTQYGKIGGFWFDGNWSRPEDDWEEDELYSLIRKYQPDAIIVNNTGIEKRGLCGNTELDSVTFEQGRPTPMNREGMQKYMAAEMCQTMNNHWGYGSHDFAYKSAYALIETLCACRKVGANYLLNVGPTGEGRIPLLQEALLYNIGEWIKAVGTTAIYEGKPCGIAGETDKKDFALRSGNKIWFFIHDMNYTGNKNRSPEGGGNGVRAFTGIADGTVLENLHWTDSNEPVNASFRDGRFFIDCPGYPYGTSLVVRIAEANIK